MPHEEEPITPDHAPAAAALPDVENLADSEDPDVILARAKLLEAQATLTKASTPLLDKIIIRGLLPIALTIVGPWALWQFDASQTEQKKQGEVIGQLQDLLEGAQAEATSRRERSAKWQVRMAQIDEEKATELTAMSTMVCRLDDMLKIALIQTAVARFVDQTPQNNPSRAGRSMPDRAAVLQDAADQVHLPGLEVDEVKRIAGQQYDRMVEQRRK